MGRLALTKQEFIDRANGVHENKYDYSNIDYYSTLSKITITCPKHGRFEQLAINHLNGHGCSKCNRKNKIKKLEKSFIKQSKKLHNNKYDYSNVNYVSATEKVKLCCSKHGDFYQTPNAHLCGTGCPSCWKEQKKSNTEEFIKKAILKHSNKFNYDKVKYTKSNEKVIITCFKHGDFNQKPNDHLNGQGCPGCRESKGERRISDILDKYDITYKREFKLPIDKERSEYDFFLPAHNLLIEFHGQQHFNVIDYFGGKERLEYTKACDEKKRQIAKHFKIPLLEISYHSLKLSQEEFETFLISEIKKIIEV